MINLAPLNNHIYNQPFKMEGLENLRYLLNPGDYFVKTDLLGCLSIHSSPRGLTTIPGIYFSPSHICFQTDIGKGNLPVYRNVLSYSPCSKGSSNPLSTTSTPSDNLTERKFTFKILMLLNEIHASPPCPARSGLVDTQSFHLNFKRNYTSYSRHLHSDRHFRPGAGKLPETPKDFGNVDKEPTFLAHKQKGINCNFSQSKVFPKIPGKS